MGCSVHPLGLGASWAVTGVVSCCHSFKTFLIQDRLSYQKVRFISLKNQEKPIFCFSFLFFLFFLFLFLTSPGFFPTGIQSHVPPPLPILTMISSSWKKPHHSLPRTVRCWHHLFIYNGQILSLVLERSWIQFCKNLYWAPTICQPLGFVRGIQRWVIVWHAWRNFGSNRECRNP